MSQMKIPPAEMEILRYIMEHQPISVRGVAEHVAETKGHTRTTVLNLMERLRQKGYLDRKQKEGVYRYWPTMDRSQLMRMQVRHFVTQSLGGSIEPFMVYLTEEADVDDQELEELKQVVSRLDARRADNMTEE
jgi:predicted transcriptional regulator